MRADGANAACHTLSNHRRSKGFWGHISSSSHEYQPWTRSAPSKGLWSAAGRRKRGGHAGQGRRRGGGRGWKEDKHPSLLQDGPETSRQDRNRQVHQRVAPKVQQYYSLLSWTLATTLSCSDHDTYEHSWVYLHVILFKLHVLLMLDCQILLLNVSELGQLVFEHNDRMLLKTEKKARPKCLDCQTKRQSETVLMADYLIRTQDINQKWQNFRSSHLLNVRNCWYFLFYTSECLHCTQCLCFLDCWSNNTRLLKMSPLAVGN